MKFTISPSRRIVLLLLTFVFGMLVTGVLTGLITSIGGEERRLAMMRIGAVIQDMIMLVLPALLTAVLVTRRPARLLAVDRLPALVPSLAAIAVMLVASPAMSAIIEWNAGLHLPASMASLEEALRAMEEKAGAAVDFMAGPHTTANLLMSVLIIGVLAGFSEELFFRGALQRIISFSPVGRTGAIWVSAVIFSAIHMQFFGFVPRLLLGLYFGYLLAWSGSVWLPVAAHMANNALYVILRYYTGTGEPELVPEGSTTAVAIGSAVLTCLGLIMLKRMFARTSPTDTSTDTQ